MARSDYGAILSTVIKDTSDAIREVKGTNALISPAEWGSEIRSIPGGSEIRSIPGGGFVPPTNEWYGTPDQYKALASKTDDTIYKTLFDDKIPSADFIGNNQISPVNLDFDDYDILVSRINPIRQIFDTGYQWYNNNLEIRFSLHDTSYSGTQVLFSNGNGSPDFNLILSGTQMMIYTPGYNQTVIDTIQADTEYVYRKENGVITISRGGVELFNTTQTTVNTSTINLFGWRNQYYFEGILNYLTVKTL